MMAESPFLQAHDLTKTFGGLAALDRLNLEVREREIVGLIGPNGSGKTTFFNVVTGIYPATSGKVQYRGRDITNFSPQKVSRAGISRTFQRSRLCLPLSIFDNIMIGNHQHLNHGLWFNLARRGALRRQVKESLDAAREFIQIFDAPLADRIMEPVGRFPMIDRRRIEICRALISRPKLLLLDEPSAGMTQDETRQLMDEILVVKERIAGLTVILIEHEMNVIKRITDRCIVLNFGRKIIEGTYEQVAADKQVQQAYLGVG